MNYDRGTNFMEMSGFANENMFLFESRQGTPAIRFSMSVGEEPFSFHQVVVVYGGFAIELSKHLTKGDLVLARGKKMILTLPNDFGYRERTDCMVTTEAYILETKVNRLKRQSKGDD